MAILFSDVVLLLERISHRSNARHRSSQTPVDHLRHWLSLLSPETTHRQGLLIFRLLFPDREVRRRYGLKEALLGRELAKALNLPASCATALASWNDAHSAGIEGLSCAVRTSGCFGLALQAVLAPRRAVRNSCTLDTGSGSLTLEQVDGLLDELASHCEYSDASLRPNRTASPQRTRQAILHELFSTLSPREAAYMAQIILRDLGPLLYPLTSTSAEKALLSYNSKHYTPLALEHALSEWNWALGTIYRFRADLDEAFGALAAYQVQKKSAYTEAERKALLAKLSVPHVGTRIEIPKAAKGRSLRSVAAAAAENGLVYLETKYDGERMQIHVDMAAPDPEDRLTIFSKSKRDSTKDRILTHAMIYAALSLPPSTNPASSPSPHLLTRMHEAAQCGNARRNAGYAAVPVHDVVLEAEMVPYNEAEEAIDEFGYLSDCTVDRMQQFQNAVHDDVESSQASSLLSVVAPQRHLAVVFFDILHLNGRSLIFEPYEERRRILEDTIQPIEGYSMLAERIAIDFSRLNAHLAYEALVKAFARCIVDRQEGLMLKPASSTYNDARRGQQWVKLKRDYIPGLGDSASFVIVGASWSKERGRELNVPSTCFTTFYVGLLENGWALASGADGQPRYHVLFSVEYFASREMLALANRKLLERGGLDRRSWASRVARSWAFALSFSPSLDTQPTFILSSPLAFELFGASFVRPRGSPHYVLRFPRVSAVHHSRSPEECVDLPGLQAMAREATSWLESEAEEEVDDLWKRFSDPSSGEGEGGGSDVEGTGGQGGSMGWRARQEKEWYDKLSRADNPRLRHVKSPSSSTAGLDGSGLRKRRKSCTISPRLILRKAPRHERGQPAAKKASIVRASALLAATAATARKSRIAAEQSQASAHLAYPTPPPSSSAVATRSTDAETASALLAPALELTNLKIQSRPASPSSDDCPLSSTACACFGPYERSERAASLYWTVYPRRPLAGLFAQLQEILPAERRVHSVNRVMEGAGWSRRKEPDGIAISIAGNPSSGTYSQGIIFTEAEKAEATLREMREGWIACDHACAVWICDFGMLNAAADCDIGDARSGVAQLLEQSRIFIL